MKKFYFLLLLLIPTFCSYAQEIPQGIPKELGIYENLDGYIDTNLFFFNEKGEKVILGEALDKPTALVLVFFKCRGICSPLMDGVAKLIDETDLELGEDYQIFNISFAPEESWELGRDKKINYVSQVEKEFNEEAWMFMAGDTANINSICDSVGFKYYKEGDQYIHGAALIILSPEGKITRYFINTQFNPFDFKMAIIEANEGRSAPTMNRVLQYCFSYDPDGQKYVFNITKVAATIILLFVVSFLLWLFFSKRNKSPKKIATENEGDA